MDENLINVDQLRPFPRFLCTVGMLPTSFKMSLTYEEQMMEIIKFIRDEIIPNVNQNALATKELQEKFVELVNYVDTYFDNLDLQDEVNNKIEAMAESGDLQEIITAYINLKSILCYNTVADMKNATNLVNGSYAQTLGFYSANDGGNATYKIRTITNEDVVDNSRIISLNNDITLIAELIYNHKLNVKTFGAKGDGITEDSTIIQHMIDIANDGDTIYFPNGTYLVQDLSITKRLNLIGENSETINTTGGSTLLLADDNEYIVDILGTNATRIVGLNIKNINFNGNFKETTTLLNAKYFTFMNIEECSFNNVNGSAIQVACGFESSICKSVFRRCGNETNAVIDMLNYTDSAPSNNINNLHIENNTFGLNSGNWIKAENSANIDVLWILNNKFEYDNTPTWANENENAVIYLGSINRCHLKNNNFTNFSLANNKYTKIIECLNGMGSVSIIDNKLYSCDNGTFITSTNPIIISKDNIFVNCSSFNDINVQNSQIIHKIKPSYLYATNGSLIHNTINSSRPKTYTESLEIPNTNKYTLQYDAGSINYTKMAVKSTANARLGEIENFYKGMSGTNITIKFRAKKLDSTNPIIQFYKRTSSGLAPLSNNLVTISSTDWTWYSINIALSELTDANYIVLIQNNVETPILIDGYVLPL